jgi:protein TonB
MRGANGLVRFRLDVDPEGHVGACHVLKSIQSPDFEKITCDLIRKRARFKPALDASGKPTPSYYVNTVKWVMG